MKKHFLFFWLFLLAFSGKIFAQEVSGDSVAKLNPYRNSVYVELGGNAIVGSVNHEWLFKLNDPAKTLAFRIGGLFFPAIKIMGGETTYELLIPVELSILSGRKAVRPEFGIGLTYYWASGSHIIYSDRYETSKNSMLFTVVRLGARWQPPSKSYFVRAGFTPVFFGAKATNSTLPFMPFLGVSFGKSFAKK